MAPPLIHVTPPLFANSSRKLHGQFLFCILLLPRQSFIEILRVCLVGVKIERMKNKVENDIFHCLVEERKQERQKIGRKIFPPGPPFFILPIWEENEEEKVLKDILYTNTLNIAFFFFFLGNAAFFFPSSFDFLGMGIFFFVFLFWVLPFFFFF